MGAYAWPESYESSSQLLVKLGRENASVNPGALTSQPIINLGVRKEVVNSEIEILKSRSLIEETVSTLGTDFLFPNPPPPESFLKKIKFYTKKALKKGFDYAMEVLYLLDLRKRLTPHEAAVKKIEKKLKVAAVKNSNVIEVSVRWSHPVITAEIVNTALRIYLKDRTELYKISNVYGFFSGEVEALKQKLAASENRLREFKQRWSITSLKEQRSLLLGETSKLKVSLQQTDTEIIEIEKKIEELRAQLAATPRRTRLSEKVMRDPVIDSMRNKLKELEDERAALQDRDPAAAVVRLDGEIARVSRMIDKRKRGIVGSITTGVNELYQNLENDLLKAEIRLASLRERKGSQEGFLDKYLAELKELEGREVELLRLERQFRIDDENYKLYMQKMEESRIFDAMDSAQIGNMSIISPAMPSPAPVRPRKLLIVVLGAFVGIFGGVGMAFLAESLDHSLRTPEDVEDYIGVPLLASVREVIKRVTGGEKDNKDAGLALSTAAEMDEDCRLLKNNLLLSCSKERNTLLFLSSTGSEGGSTIAINLAAALAEDVNKKVVYIDLNIASPALDGRFGSKLKGWTDFLVDETALEDIVTESGVGNLSVIPAGGATANMSLLFKSPRVERFFDAVKREFDFVVLDGAPPMRFSESLFLAPYIDGTVIVVRAGKTRREAVKRTKEYLVENEIPVLGVVLNRKRHYIPRFIYRKL